MSIQTIHQYQRAVDEGLLDPLKCPEDGERLFTDVVDLDADEPEPVLFCYQCTTRIYPGLNLLDTLKRELERLRRNR